MKEAAKLLTVNNPQKENKSPAELTTPTFDQIFVASVLAVSKIKTNKIAVAEPVKPKAISKFTDTDKNGGETWCGSSCKIDYCPGSCTVTADHSGPHFGNCGHTW